MVARVRSVRFRPVDQEDFCALHQRLEEVDYLRTQLVERSQQMYWDLLQNPRLHARWKDFLRAGGATAEDWRLYARGQPLRGVKKASRHPDVRLLVSNPPRPFKKQLRGRRSGDLPPAA
jgi:hypothetical protein